MNTRLNKNIGGNIMLVKWKPFGSVINNDAFFNDFFNESFPVAKRSFEPTVDVRENDKQFVISAELPGLSKDDFKITVENNTLILEGEKKIENEEKAENYYRSERSYGKFRRAFRLTDTVDSGKIKADYKNGILEIEIPKSEKAQPKHIEVKIN
jgi:HSP20 family protein